MNKEKIDCECNEILNNSLEEESDNNNFNINNNKNNNLKEACIKNFRKRKISEKNDIQEKIAKNCESNKLNSDDLKESDESENSDETSDFWIVKNSWSTKWLAFFY